MYLKDYPFYAYVSYSCLTASSSKKVQKNSNAAFQIIRITHIYISTFKDYYLRQQSPGIIYVKGFENTHLKLTQVTFRPCILTITFIHTVKRIKGQMKQQGKKEYILKLCF